MEIMKVFENYVARYGCSTYSPGRSKTKRPPQVKRLKIVLYEAFALTNYGDHLMSESTSTTAVSVPVNPGFWAALSSVFGTICRSAVFVEKRVIAIDQLCSNEETNLMELQAIRLDANRKDRAALLAQA